MRTKLVFLILLLCMNFNAQSLDKNFDMYRVVAYSNADDYYYGTVEIYSVSNTIRVPYHSTIFVPNAFSPDGDNTNDMFQVIGKGLNHITIEIYNRWGQLVFEAPNLSEPWDGTYRGQPCPIGTYVYQLKVDALTSQAGTITLIR